MRVRIAVEGVTSPSNQFIEEGALVLPDDCPVTMDFELPGRVEVGRARDFQRDGDAVITADVTLFRGDEFEPEAVTMELAQVTLGGYDSERHPSGLNPEQEPPEGEEPQPVPSIVTKGDIVSVHLVEFDEQR